MKITKTLKFVLSSSLLLLILRCAAVNCQAPGNLSGSQGDTSGNLGLSKNNKGSDELHEVNNGFGLRLIHVPKKTGMTQSRTLKEKKDDQSNPAKKEDLKKVGSNHQKPAARARLLMRTAAEDHKYK